MTNPAKYVFIDTETGGLSTKTNPLLSIAVVLADEYFNELDGFAIKIRPPANTVLEMPIPAHRVHGLMTKKIESYVNVYSNTPDHPDGRPVITAVAAEINGFVGTQPGVPGWSLEPAKAWLVQGAVVKDAERQLRQYLRQFFQVQPQAVAHNSPFDQGYLVAYMPLLAADLAPTWMCTQQTYTNVRNGVRKGTKLIDLCNEAGQPLGDRAHEALADCKGALVGAKYLTTVKKASLAYRPYEARG